MKNSKTKNKQINFRRFFSCFAFFVLPITNLCTPTVFSTKDLTKQTYKTVNEDSADATLFFTGKDTAPTGTIYYSTNDTDKTIDIISCSGLNGQDLTLNTNIQIGDVTGYYVANICANAFASCSSISGDLMLNTIDSNFNGIEYIYENAFSNCDRIKLVSLPRSCKEIKDNAFKNCTSLVNLSATSALTTIGDNCLANCSSLMSVNFPSLSGLNYIGEDAFKNCQNLMSADLSQCDSELVINANAFAGCRNLQTIDVPSDSSYYQKYSFNTLGSAIVESNTLDNNQWTISTTTVGGLANGIIDFSSCTNLVSIAPNAFEGCSQIESVVFPNRLSVINQSAFSGCTNLQKLIFNDGLQEIKPSAFANCHNLDYVSFPNENIKIGDDAFSGCYINTIVFNNPDPYWMDNLSPTWYVDDLLPKHYVDIYVPKGTVDEYEKYLKVHADKATWYDSKYMTITDGSKKPTDHTLVLALGLGLGLGIPLIACSIFLIVYATKTRLFRRYKKNKK